MFEVSAQLHAARLIDLALHGTDLVLVCEPCQRSDVWDRREMARRFPRGLGATVAQLRERVRCATCGGPVTFKRADAVDADEQRVWSPDHQAAQARYFLKVRAELGLPPGGDA